MSLPFKMKIETEMERYRAETFWTKEPETVAWITSFDKGEVFYDIGANVGMYSLYCASINPYAHIYAFEPVPSNHWRLVQNIQLNRFQNIHALNMALADKTCLERLYIPDTEIGKSGAQISKAVDECGQTFNAENVCIVPSITLARFIQVFNPKYPNHIKIDVDGHEGEIISGLSELLFAGITIKSVLIECNEGLNTPMIRALMTSAGFTTDNPFNIHENHSRYRRKMEGVTAENIVFTRR